MSEEKAGLEHNDFDSAKESSVVVAASDVEQSSSIATTSHEFNPSITNDNSYESNEATDVTATGGDEGTVDVESNSSLAKGVSSLISSVIRDFDSRAESTIRSQDQLTFSLDRLTAELDQLLDDAPLPFIMQQAAKISGVRKRVSSLNAVLKSIQQRVDNIDRMLSAGLPHENLDRQGSEQH